jgi:iron complex transport system substrate-binding protein
VIHRRRFVAGLGAATLAAPALAQEAPLVDGAGRKLVIPRHVERVMPAGTPAAIKVYTLAPETLIGWPRANPAEELEFLLPGIARRPTVGWITSRGNAANLEAVLAERPDLIVDSGSLRPTYVELAERVQAQTGVPYALLDGSFSAIANSYAVLGALLGRQARAAELGRYAQDSLRTISARVATVPMAQRPRVYYARGPAGLETGLGGSINIEILEFMGLPVVSAGLRGGMSTVSIEQVLQWNPEVIVTIDPGFAATVRDNPLWKGVRAVQAGRVHLAPKSPFNWFDFPPGVNRLPGLWWLGKLMFPALFAEDLRTITRDFNRLFYGVSLSDEQLGRVLAGRG